MLHFKFERAPSIRAHYRCATRASLASVDKARKTAAVVLPAAVENRRLRN